MHSEEILTDRRQKKYIKNELEVEEDFSFNIQLPILGKRLKLEVE